MIGNLGMAEIIIIAGIALVVIGPEKFPEFAKIVLRSWRDFRGYFEDVKTEIDKELRPVKKEMQQLSRYDPEDYIDSLTGTTSSESEESSYPEAAEPPPDTDIDSEPTDAPASEPDEAGPEDTGDPYSNDSPDAPAEADAEAEAEEDASQTRENHDE